MCLTDNGSEAAAVRGAKLHGAVGTWRSCLMAQYAHAVREVVDEAAVQMCPASASHQRPAGEAFEQDYQRTKCQGPASTPLTHTSQHGSIAGCVHATVKPCIAASAHLLQDNGNPEQSCCGARTSRTAPRSLLATQSASCHEAALSALLTTHGSMHAVCSSGALLHAVVRTRHVPGNIHSSALCEASRHAAGAAGGSRPHTGLSSCARLGRGSVWVIPRKMSVGMKA